MITLSLLAATLALASTAPAGVDYDSSAVKVRAVLGKMVAADTTNPPGNEERIVKIVAEHLKEAGIPYEVTEFAPGRQNIVARLKASGEAKDKPLMLLAHIDVVGAGGQEWSTKPHEMTEKDGFLYGRGVNDDLGMAAIALETVLELKRKNVPLKRDVILALTGDEESGGAGILHLLKNHKDQIDAGVVINEGGSLALGNEKDAKIPHLISMQVAEKSYQDFVLTAKGPTGHSSVPLEGNAITKLSKAVAKIGAWEQPARILPVTRAYFSARSGIEKDRKLGAAMKALADAKGARLPATALKVIEADPSLRANLRTTCTPTIVKGGTRENALPSQAVANINCRILPDESIEQVQAHLKKLVGDDSIEIRASQDMGAGPASPVSGEVPAAVKKTAEDMGWKIPLVPTLSRGATDSRFLREAGIPCYGIDPMPISEDDSRRAHGVDERIPVASVRTGIEFFDRLVRELAQAK